MSLNWMAGARHLDLSKSPYRRGNGPFAPGGLYGVCLHVNVDEYGTPDSFWENNAGQVTPNFQVYKDGSIHQLLPFNWQPWCQVDGNFHYAAIETAGLPGEKFTDAQMRAIAHIYKHYVDFFKVHIGIANTPGARGFIIHSAGGQAWGGHSCPGTLRAGERSEILNLVKQWEGTVPAPSPKPNPNPKVYTRHSWPTWMPDGHYFGLITGPDESHGGISPREQSAVGLIQDRLKVLGFTTNDSHGTFNTHTKAAVTAWQKKHYASTTTNYGEVWRDDWHHLFTY